MKRSFYSLVLVVLVVNFLAGTWFGYRSQRKALASPAKELGPTPDAQPAAAPAQLSEKTNLILPGQSISQALSQLGVPQSLILEWQELARPVYDLSMVRPGQKIILRVDKGGKIEQFELEIGRQTGSLLITREGKGFEAELKQLAPAPEKQKDLAGPGITRKFYAGTIETNFYQAGIDAGMEPELIMNMAGIFSVQFSFSSIMKNGDKFEVLTEVLPSGDEKIIAAKVIVTGKTYQAFYFARGNAPAYFDEKGRAWEGFQLIKPVRNARISSTYTHRRFHPILGYFTPHLAVDYAAPQGTPVRAAAAGVVTYAGWRGGYGNYIEVRHNPTYTTTYGHMYGIARGIHVGTRVKQGQVIGYVGMTGLATGPHLDYRVLKYGGSVNPLTFKGERLRRVDNVAMFQKSRLVCEIEMQSFKDAIDIPGEKAVLVAST